MEEHSDYMRGFVHRTTMLLGEQRMATLADCTVAIAGCGGVGGATAITLARLGVGGFVLADPGIFDPPDLNRQWAGTRATLDQNKARVHRDLLLQINPNLRLTVFEEGVTDTNLDAFLEPADLLLDCLDISVPLPLRSRVYRAAQQRGLHGITAPIFGFGTMIVIARPDGMGMDAMIEQFVEVASRDSKLPPGFPGYFFGPHLDAVEREIHKHRVPTSSISVTVATGFVAAEIVRILLGASYPELDPSPTLPDVVVIDPLRLTLAVVPYTALFQAQNAVDRVAALQAADQNPVLLPAPAIDTDALSDSWSELPPPVRWAPKTSQQLEDLLAERFGFPHNLPVFRGRFAEACLAPAILEGPGQVITNGLFPSTRFHLEAHGATIEDLGSDVDADLDLARVETALATGTVRALWVEPCNNSRLGAPLSEANFARAAALARAAGVPVILDATRLHTNAVLLRDAGDPRSLEALVRDLAQHADACTASLTKDFLAPRGGFIGLRDAAQFRDLAHRIGLMTGTGLDDSDRSQLADALAAPLSSIEHRSATVAKLAAALAAQGLPTCHQRGGHAVFVDAAVLRPGAAHAAWEVAREVFLRSGIRIAPNLSAPSQIRAGHAPVRIAVAVGGPGPAAPALIEALSSTSVAGLELLPGAAFPPRFRVLS